MNDSRTLFAADSGKGFAMMEQSVDQSVLAMARARMRVSQCALPVVSVKAERTRIRSTSPIAR